MRHATGDPLNRPPLGRRQVVGNKYMPMFKQVTDLPLQTIVSPRKALGRSAARTAATQRRLFRGKLLPHLTDRVEYRLGDFGQHVEFTDLMPRARENRCNWPRIQGRTVGGDALQNQSAGVQSLAEGREELADVFVRGVVVQNPIDSTQYGPSYNSSAAMYPEKSASAQSR